MMDDDWSILYSEKYSHKALKVIFLSSEGGVTLLWVLKQSRYVTGDFLNDAKCDEIRDCVTICDEYKHKKTNLNFAHRLLES